MASRTGKRRADGKGVEDDDDAIGPLAAGSAPGSALRQVKVRFYFKTTLCQQRWLERRALLIFQYLCDFLPPYPPLSSPDMRAVPFRYLDPHSPAAIP